MSCRFLTSILKIVDNALVESIIFSFLVPYSVSSFIRAGCTFECIYMLALLVIERMRGRMSCAVLLAVLV